MTKRKRSPHSIDCIRLSACPLNLRMTRHFLAHKRSNTYSREMAICLRILGWYRNLLQIPRRTSLLCPQCLETLKECSRYLSSEIRKFSIEKIGYLCHVKRPRWLKITSHMVKAIRGLQPPTDVTYVKSFWACATYSDETSQTSRVYWLIQIENSAKTNHQPSKHSAKRKWSPRIR